MKAKVGSTENREAVGKWGEEGQMRTDKLKREVQDIKSARGMFKGSDNFAAAKARMEER